MFIAALSVIILSVCWLDLRVYGLELDLSDFKSRVHSPHHRRERIFLSVRGGTGYEVSNFLWKTEVVLN